MGICTNTVKLLTCFCCTIPALATETARIDFENYNAFVDDLFTHRDTFLEKQPEIGQIGLYDKVRLRFPFTAVGKKSYLQPYSVSIDCVSEHRKKFFAEKRYQRIEGDLIFSVNGHGDHEFRVGFDWFAAPKIDQRINQTKQEISAFTAIAKCSVTHETRIGLLDEDRFYFHFVRLHSTTEERVTYYCIER